MKIGKTLLIPLITLDKTEWIWRYSGIKSTCSSPWANGNKALASYPLSLGGPLYILFMESRPCMCYV